MESKTCKLCNISDFITDEDYQICYNCFFFYYDDHNPNLKLNFEIGKIIDKKSNELINNCINCNNM